MRKLKKLTVGDIKRNLSRCLSPAKHTNSIDEDIKSAFNALATESKESLTKEIKKCTGE